MRVRSLLGEAAAAIGGDSAGADAEMLLADALGTTRGWLLAHGDDAVPEAVQARFADRVARRQGGEPVAMILGRQGFWTLDLAVDGHTLVPRPETERLVELALERLPLADAADVLDLGTGSGAIALAIASERPRARVTAVEASGRALAVARANAARLGLALRLLEGDWFAPVAAERFDLIVSNPPYLAEDDPHLAALRHEPRGALVSGVEGFDAIEAIVNAAPGHLREGGWLLLEHGWTQGEGARQRLSRAGFSDVATWRDLEGRERVSGGRIRAANA